MFCSGKPLIQSSGSSIVADLAMGEPSDRIFDVGGGAARHCVGIGSGAGTGAAAGEPVVAAAAAPRPWKPACSKSRLTICVSSGRLAKLTRIFEKLSSAKLSDTAGTFDRWISAWWHR